MITAVDKLLLQGKAARKIGKTLGALPTERKNQAIGRIAAALQAHQREILEANGMDCEAGAASGLPESILDRILLTSQRLESMSENLRNIMILPDPVGEVFDMSTRPNGLMVGKKRVPLGVIGAIYENRPNVTVDISALCIKSGNACILRGGREAIHSNRVLVAIIRKAIGDAGITEDVIQFVDDPDHKLVVSMLRMNQYIDLIIPRGGAEFIRFVIETATMPVVAGGVGVCHTYVDKSADLDKAVSIANNAKVRRPSVCNALDTLLVHVDMADRYLPRIARQWAEAGVEIRCDQRSLGILRPLETMNVKPAVAEDWGKEFLALIASVRVLDSLDEALEHITEYGSGHSEAIVTEDYGTAMRFLDEVDAAAVYVNASTYFTDGAEFGLGAEVGISTQKFHARGPMGLGELTSYKWIIFGNGQVRL